MWISEGHVVDIGGVGIVYDTNSNLSGLHCHLRPLKHLGLHCCKGHIWVCGSVAPRNCVDVTGLCYSQRLCKCPWSELHCDELAPTSPEQHSKAGPGSKCAGGLAQGHESREMSSCWLQHCVSQGTSGNIAQLVQAQENW